MALALASTARDQPIDPGVVACGEVTLLGGLRPVRGLERRLREAARLGFRRAVVPVADEAGRLGTRLRAPSATSSWSRSAPSARPSRRHGWTRWRPWAPRPIRYHWGSAPSRRLW
ncbi:MAG: S16 family serine protease [Chloroflexota bacterium]